MVNELGLTAHKQYAPPFKFPRWKLVWGASPMRGTLGLLTMKG